MSAEPVIFDTNVLISMLPTARGATPYARLLDGMLDGSICCAVSGPLLAEYREVLGRPKLLKRLGLTLDKVDTLVASIAARAVHVEPVAAPPAPDPGDQLLWELLAARADLWLVTGDRALLDDRAMRGRVVSSDACLARFLAQGTVSGVSPAGQG